MLTLVGMVMLEHLTLEGRGSFNRCNDCNCIGPLSGGKDNHMHGGCDLRLSEGDEGLGVCFLGEQGVANAWLRALKWEGVSAVLVVSIFLIKQTFWKAKESLDEREIYVRQ